MVKLEGIKVMGIAKKNFGRKEYGDEILLAASKACMRLELDDDFVIRKCVEKLMRLKSMGEKSAYDLLMRVGIALAETEERNE